MVVANASFRYILLYPNIFLQGDQKSKLPRFRNVELELYVYR